MCEQTTRVSTPSSHQRAARGRSARGSRQFRTPAAAVRPQLKSADRAGHRRERTARASQVAEHRLLSPSRSPEERTTPTSAATTARPSLCFSACRRAAPRWFQPSNHCGCLIERRRSTEAAGTRSTGDVNNTGYPSAMRRLELPFRTLVGETMARFLWPGQDPLPAPCERTGCAMLQLHDRLHCAIRTQLGARYSAHGVTVVLEWRNEPRRD